MQLKALFEKWGLTQLKIKGPFWETTWAPQDPDKSAAWALYVELLTRISTQPLKHGTEEAALASVHSLFETTRLVLKENGRGCVQFSRVAVVVLNHVVRPFTEKWHPVLENKKVSAEKRKQFRKELEALRIQLVAYNHILAEIADVEDITELPDTNNI